MFRISPTRPRCRRCGSPQLTACAMTGPSNPVIACQAVSDIGWTPPIDGEPSERQQRCTTSRSSTGNRYRGRGPAPPDGDLDRLPGHRGPDLRRLRPRRLRHRRLHLPARPERRSATVTPAIAGALGSYALVGVLVGALLAGQRRRHPRPPQGDAVLLRLVLHRHGADGDDDQHDDVRAVALRHRPGRRRPGRDDRRRSCPSTRRRGRRTCATRSPTAGVPLGSLLAALLAIVLLERIGWRGMFLIGALPLVTLLPLAVLQDAGVGGLAGRPRAHGRGPRDLGADRRRDPGDAAQSSRSIGAPEAGGRAGFAGLFGATTCSRRSCSG